MSRSSLSKKSTPSKANCKKPPLVAVSIKFGKTIRNFTLAEMLEPAALDAAILGGFEASTADPEVRISDLASFADKQRFQLLLLLQQGGRPFKLACGDRTAPLRSRPLDAVFDALAGETDLSKVERIMRAAIEFVACFQADASLAASQEIADRVRSAGLKGVLPQMIRKDIESILGTDRSDVSTLALASKFINLHQARSAQVGGACTASQEPSLIHYSGIYWGYDGNKWRRDTHENLRILITKFLQQQPEGREITTQLVNNVEANVKALTHVPSTQYSWPLWLSDTLDNPPSSSPYLAFANGIVNLEQAITSGSPPQVRAHTSKHFSPTCLDFAFDSQAQCPLWRQTLAEILPVVRGDRGETPDRRVRVVQELIGYTLTPGLRQQKCGVLVGRGANGKSLITQVWTDLLGSGNVSSVAMSQLGTRFSVAEMEGKLANFASEITRLDKVDEGLLKALVSGDPVQAERKFQTPFTLLPTAKLIFTTNELPPIRDTTDGVHRRFIIVPFLRQFMGHDCDPDRANQLRRELPGIFNWALAGARRLHQRGRFSDCGQCAAALAEHRLESNIVAQFLAETPLGVGGSEAEIPAGQYYSDFLAWCGRNGRMFLGSTEFGRRLRALGIVNHRRSDAHPITHIRSHVYRRVDAARTPAVSARPRRTGSRGRPSSSS
jgi:P4 family phage/plasmid primase-like protien